jgi:hypothetical protein
MKFDRAHLHTRKETRGTIDEQIGFLMSILLQYADLLDGIAKATGVMLLEKAFFGPALGATDEADRPAPCPWQHDRGDSFIIIRQLALAELEREKAVPLIISDERYFTIFEWKLVTAFWSIIPNLARHALPSSHSLHLLVGLPDAATFI